jgi:hypothetical protein
MLAEGFCEEFKREIEEIWGRTSLDPQVYGFQFQAGTRWLPGLSDEQILAYENEVQARFPFDFQAFLRTMNGTDLATLNIYGSSGEPSRESVGVYSFPRDLERVKRCIAEAGENHEVLIATLRKEGFELSRTAKLIPIYAHRFLVCDEDRDKSAVLSIWDSEDAIVYGMELQEYLEREFLGITPDWAK